MAESRARVIELEDVGPETVVVRAELLEPEALVARPGQFLSIRIDDAGAVRRSYTLLSHTSSSFELLVKRVAGGAGSTYFEDLAVGDELGFTGPMGFFSPDPDHRGDALVIATGAGIAAALPVARACAGKVALLYGVRDAADALLITRLGGLVWELVTGDDWAAVHATLAERAVAAAASMRDARFYLTGNGDMTRVVRDALVATGVDRKQQVRTEIFYPTAEP